MTSVSETVRPLYVEQTLVDVTRRRSNPCQREVHGTGRQWPAELGPLAVDRLRFDPDHDAGSIVRGVRNDFQASYEMKNTEAAHERRQWSIAWLDWFARDTSLDIPDFTYLHLAATSAEQGDAETVRQIVEDPKRLWFDRRTDIPLKDPTFGQLDGLSTRSISARISKIAALMTTAPQERKTHVRAAVMPTLRRVVTELARRDLTGSCHSVELTGGHLLAAGTPGALGRLDVLVRAMPMTAARLDALIRLSEKDKRFGNEAAEALTWHQAEAGLAEYHLAKYLKSAGTTRNVVDYQVNRSNQEAASAQRAIAATIVDQIPPDTDGTSAIETSVAYTSGSFYNASVQGDILQCVRTLTGNPQFAFADPQFGFAARFVGNEQDYAHRQVTVIDANLPEGRVVIDLSDEPFRGNTTYKATSLLCQIIQAEKNRRSGIV